MYMQTFMQFRMFSSVLFQYMNNELWFTHTYWTFTNVKQIIRVHFLIHANIKQVCLNIVSLKLFLILSDIIRYKRSFSLIKYLFRHFVDNPRFSTEY